MEVVGVVLGAIPLIISAMEYYPKMKELGMQYWKFRRARQDELRQIAFCKELLKLHLRALLHMSSAEVESFLKNPADKIWKDGKIENQLKQRLAGSFDTYSGILAIAEKQMAQIMRAAKVDDEAFSNYMVTSVAQPSDAEDIKVRVAAFFRRSTIQPRIGILALGHHERELLLEKLEKSIKRLKELLEAVDGVSETNKTQQITRNYKVPAVMLGFAERAERIWRLIHEHLRCACKSKHCARLWFDRSSMAQDSLGLVFLFDKAIPWTAEPWKRHRLKIHRSSTQCSCGHHSVQQKATIQHSPRTPAITIQSAAAGSSITVQTAAADPSSSSGQMQQDLSTTVPALGTSSISASGLCEILKHHEEKHVCLGALCSSGDEHPYHFLSHQDNESHDFVSLSSIMDPHTRPFLELRPRMKLAAMLASAHLRYFRTSWVPFGWKLQDICFPTDPQDASSVQFDMPYILADFQESLTTQKPHVPALDQGFVTLGILLLELCFGRPLEMHTLWSSANGSLNPADPFHRQYVAGQWAKTIDLMIDGPEYTKAVEWCLRQAHTDDKNEGWRNEFAMNVLGPLLKSANLLP